MGRISYIYTSRNEGKHTALLKVAERQGRSPSWSWRRHLGTLGPILAIYLVLAFYGIDRQSLWADEYYSVLRVTASKYPVWKDGHGFLYFALLNLWIQLGTSELVLRSLSVLLGTLAVCLTYVLGIALLGQRAAVIASALFATSPFLIWYSQEVRYITLMLVTTLLTMYAFHRVISRPTLGRWVFYGSASLLAFFSFLSTLLLPVAQVLYLLSSPYHRPVLKKWLVCQGAIFVLFALWFVHGTHFLGAILEARSSGEPIVSNSDVFPFSGFFNQVRAEVIPYTFFALSVGFSLGPSPSELYAARSLAPVVPHAPMLFVLAVLYGGLFLSGWAALRRQRDCGLLLALWVGVPVLCVFGIAKFFNIFYEVRYVAMVLPAYVLLVGAGVASMRKLGAQILLFGAVLLVHGVSLANYYFDPRYAREDTRAAGHFLESAAGPDDIVLIVGIGSSLPHYYNASAPVVYFGRLNGTSLSVAERLRQLSKNHERLWLVQIRPWLTDPKGQVKIELDNANTLLQQHHFPGVDISAYRVWK